MNYKILEEKTVFDDFFKIKKGKITYDAFNGNSLTADRLCFERGNSVAILVYEKDTDSFLFTKQFRYPTIQSTDGWLLEIPAGSMKENDDPEFRVREEVKEEIGYELDSVTLISSSYVSPGGCSEKTFLYFAEVNSTHKTEKGGGLESEQEDIQLVKLTTKQVIAMYKANEFEDAKTIMAIQWFLLREFKD
ncbi:GDP-mannose pyrophosphatase NudK [Kordia antarctica]|uniref:GDP-mannose pyrophosphatase n=1 Tax=Kordia antarctica TaxID=1218801 RepID=A0A7L4ZGD5_9FLAO|nr:NUDIX hydrolase [Kordia antarctica]QHI35580.1 GDP-mannose pyrophosphatase NudK [Kordia antarctica]